MLKNDFKEDAKMLFKASGKKKEDIARELGVSKSAIYQYLYHISLTPKYVELAEMLGYDVEVSYEEGGDDSFKEKMAELMYEERTNYTKVGEKMGVSRQRVSEIANGILSKGYVDVVHALGYGIKVRFIKRA